MNVTSVKKMNIFKKNSENQEYKINMMRARGGEISEQANEENYEIARKHWLEEIERMEG